METTLNSATQEVNVGPKGPIMIIGENINPTGRKKLSATIKLGDDKLIRELARRQVQVGVDLHHNRQRDT